MTSTDTFSKPGLLRERKLHDSARAGPVHVTAACMQIPWRSLGQSPVIVELDSIYMLASPKTEADAAAASAAEDEEVAACSLLHLCCLSTPPDYPFLCEDRCAECHTAKPTSFQDDPEAAAVERKRKAVDAKELDWVHHHLHEEKQDPAGKEGASGGGFLRGMIDTVIGNLQLSITNVHIRYEVRRDP